MSEELAGKRLGEAVLKEVMGYKDYGAGHKCPPLFDAIRQKGAIFVLRAPERTWRQWRWHSLDDVWEVVEKLKELYFTMERILIQRDNETGVTHVACFEVDGHHLEGLYLAGNRNPCEAILKAALMAVRQNQHLTSDKEE